MSAAPKGNCARFIFRVLIEVEFFAQIKGSDRIAVRTRTAKLGNKSFHLEQEIFDTDTQEVKSRCLSILVLYDLEQKQSIPFSDEWRKAIIDYDGLTKPTPIVLT